MINIHNKIKCPFNLASANSVLPKKRSVFVLLLTSCLLSYSCKKSDGERADNNGDSSFLEVFEKKGSSAELTNEESTIIKSDIDANNISNEIIVEEETTREEIARNTIKKLPVVKSTEPKPAVTTPTNDFQHAHFKYRLSLPSEVISITEDTIKKTLFIAERNRITKIETDSAEPPQTILDSDIYKHKTSETMTPIAAISHLGDHGLWVGFVNGRVTRLKNNTWETTGGGPQFSNHRVSSIALVNNVPFIGGKGLYQWDDEYSRYLSVTEAKGMLVQAIQPVNALDASNGDNFNSLLLLSKRAAHQIQFPAKEFKTLFTLLKDDGPLSSISEFKNTILVGSHRGILKISKQGVPLKRYAEDIAIKNMIKLSEEDTIVLSREGKLYRFKSEQLSLPLSEFHYSVRHILLDSNRRMWASIKSESGQNHLISIDAEQILDLFQNASSRNLEADNFRSEIFDTACAAFEQLLHDKTFSGNIAGIIINKERYVFIKGQQVCPSGLGYLSPDGSAAILANNELVVLTSKKAHTLKLPDSLEGRDAHTIYFEPQGRIFLGTRGSGLFVRTIESQNENWEQIKSSPELSRDLVSDIMPDDKGNTWVSTRYNGVPEPSSIANYKSLHILTEHGWAHFGSNEGVTGNGISDIENFNGQIFYSTSIGLGEVKHPLSSLKYDSRQLKGRHIIETFTNSPGGTTFLGHGYFLSGLSWISDKGMDFATKESGLFSDRITKVGIDSKNRVWLLDSAGRVGVYSQNALSEIKYNEKKQLPKR